MPLSDIANVDLSGLGLEETNTGDEYSTEPNQEEETRQEEQETTEEATEETKDESVDSEKDESEKDEPEDKDKDKEKDEKDKEKKEPKPKTEAQKLASQHRALARKEKAIEKAEAEINSGWKELEDKSKEFDKAVETTVKKFEERWNNVKMLEGLAEKDAFDILQIVAEVKGMTSHELLRKAITIVSGEKPADEPLERKPEPKKAEPDPTVLALKETVEKLTKKLEEQEQEVLSKKEEEFLDSYVERGEDLITEETYPFLNSYSQEERVEMMLSVANDYARVRKTIPDPRDVLDYLEEKMEKRARALYEPLQKKESRNKVKIETPDKGVGSDTKPKVESPKVLSNKTAGERGLGNDMPRTRDRDLIAHAAKYLEEKKF